MQLNLNPKRNRLKMLPPTAKLLLLVIAMALSAFTPSVASGTKKPTDPPAPKEKTLAQKLADSLEAKMKAITFTTVKNLGKRENADIYTAWAFSKPDAGYFEAASIFGSMEENLPYIGVWFEGTVFSKFESYFTLTTTAHFRLKVTNPELGITQQTACFKMPITIDMGCSEANENSNMHVTKTPKATPIPCQENGENVAEKMASTESKKGTFSGFFESCLTRKFFRRGDDTRMCK